MRGGVLLIGGVMLDRTLRVDHYPAAGGEATVLGETDRPGGSALNAAVALSELGRDPWLVAGVGRDEAGDHIVAYLADRHLRADAVTRTTELPTGTCVIVVDPDGERTFLTDPGSQSWYEPSMVTEAAVEATSVVILTGYFLLDASQGRAVATLVAGLKARGHRVIFDPSPMVGSIDGETLRAVVAVADWVVPNERELATLAARVGGGEARVAGADGGEARSLRAEAAAAVDSEAAPLRAEATAVLHALGCRHVACKRGGLGVELSVDGVVTSVGAPSVAVVDTTGAGDAFAAGLAHALLDRLEPVSACRVAAACGALATTVDGAQGGVTASALAAILRRAPTLTERARGALLGLAVGDALGMPASFMTPSQIRTVYGRLVAPVAPDTVHQTAHGALAAGGVTDDTAETLVVARALIAGGGTFDEDAFISGMSDWAAATAILETDLIGPSTRRFLEAIRDGGDYRALAATATTNGAAMRVAPVGVVCAGDPERAAHLAVTTARPSHGSGPACAAAAAVAAVIAWAAGWEGAQPSPSTVLEVAHAGALVGEAAGREIAAPMVSHRLAWLRDHAPDRPIAGAALAAYAEQIALLFGASMQSWESVPLSIAVAAAAGLSPEEALIAVVNVGDDADTNGALVGAMCGAAAGEKALPDDWVAALGAATVETLRRTADDLVALGGAKASSTR